MPMLSALGILSNFAAVMATDRLDDSDDDFHISFTLSEFQRHAELQELVYSFILHEATGNPRMSSSTPGNSSNYPVMSAVEFLNKAREEMKGINKLVRSQREMTDNAFIKLAAARENLYSTDGKFTLNMEAKKD